VIPRKRNGKLDVRRLTADQAEAIAAFLVDHLESTRTAVERCREIIGLDPEYPGVQAQLTYTTNGHSYVRHMTAVLAQERAGARGETQRERTTTTGRTPG
jgi:hypothetical protein